MKELESWVSDSTVRSTVPWIMIVYDEVESTPKFRVESIIEVNSCYIPILFPRFLITSLSI